MTNGNEAANRPGQCSIDDALGVLADAFLQPNHGTLWQCGLPRGHEERVVGGDGIAHAQDQGGQRHRSRETVRQCLDAFTVHGHCLKFTNTCFKQAALKRDICIITVSTVAAHDLSSTSDC